MNHADEIIAFWRDVGPSSWFAGDSELDRQITERFGNAHHRAARRELDNWALAPVTSLALLLLLDQFPRNMFRSSAHSYATDPLALYFANRAIALGHDTATERQLRMFFYVPFEHSERDTDQDRAVSLFTALGEREPLDWAIRHQDTIRRFGRFPGRNAALGRTTTQPEQAWLDAGGGGFSG
jgi:uncharacterized protein (DUF924 family)